MTLHFNLDGYHNRAARDWCFDAPVKNEVRHIPSGGYRHFMRKHANKHGVAGAWRCDDSLLLFYKDHTGKIRQKTWKHATPN